jgi:hypothetical protein
MTRPTPFDLVFGGLAAERFPAIRDSLARSGADPADRERFILDSEAIALLRELVPEGGAGEAVTEHLALLHHAWLFWRDGARVAGLSREEARALAAGPAPVLHGEAGGARYIQFPERMFWAELEEGAPHEPLDGLFVHDATGSELAVLAVFGYHPAREGFSVASARGARPVLLARSGGGPAFAPVMAGGAEAGLHSLVGEAELLELAARARAAVKEG